MQTVGLEAFEDVIDIAGDVLREYLEERGYAVDQTNDLVETFNERLESYLAAFVEDLPEPEEEDEDDDQ